MADEIDMAEKAIEYHKEKGIHAVRGQLSGDGQGWCEDCGEDLTPARRQAAPWAIRCVPCAGVHERKRGGYSRG